MKPVSHPLRIEENVPSVEGKEGGGPRKFDPNTTDGMKPSLLPTFGRLAR